MQPVKIDELKNIIALKDVPDEHLEWILSHSEYYEHEDGENIHKTGDLMINMWFLLEGRVDFYMNVNEQLVYFFSFENNEQCGGIGGLLPYSRMKASPGSSYAIGKVRGLKLHKDHFHDLEQLNPELIKRFIGYMTERARFFATTKMQQEKVSALGKLAAGIAHELNNPAAAISRISEELNKRLKLNLKLTEELLNYNISPLLIQHLRELVLNKEKDDKKIKITPLQRIQKEDDINEWLNNKGYNNAEELAETFAEAGYSIEDIEKINSDLGSEAFYNILNWFENLISSELIIRDLAEASGRISLLVGAIKSHVHMDRSGSLQQTNIHSGIENTLLLLGYKIGDKKITIKKRFLDNIPDVEAYPGELNQVWNNILDNAIYAVPEHGKISIETSSSNNNVLVKITDDGPGIPKDILTRIFDPFFTTKKVGEGTGIGLDLVKNVIKHHGGEIKVNSNPGKTEFCIILPVSQNLLNKR
jgi:signal transduction histidine kinase